MVTNMMIKKSYLWILVLFLLFFRVPLTRSGAYEELIRVPTDYPTIQEAINAATSGSVIFVGSGIYYEHLIVNKTLKLVGEDCASTIIEGNGSGKILTVIADDVTIKNFMIKNGDVGILIEEACNTTVRDNIITLQKGDGIQVINSTGAIIINNLITRCGTFIPGPLLYGGAIDFINSTGGVIENNVITDNVVYNLILQYSACNKICNNTMANGGGFGIFLFYSDWNTIHHNNFINNSRDLLLSGSYNNVWDDDGEGNYWDSYNGLDDGSDGRTVGDGIGDTEIPHLGVDNYPLINPYGSVPIVWEDVRYPVVLLSNFTISSFRFIQTDKKIRFTLTGPPNTTGFCNITIPKNLLKGDPWKVVLNNMNLETIITENGNHTFISFTLDYNISTVEIIGTWVVPEFTSITIILLSTILLTLCILVPKNIFQQCIRKPEASSVVVASTL